MMLQSWVPTFPMERGPAGSVAWQQGAEGEFVRRRREAEHRRWVCRNLEWREQDNPRRKEWWGGGRLQCRESFGCD